jgi:hypothetical protein
MKKAEVKKLAEDSGKLYGIQERVMASLGKDNSGLDLARDRKLIEEHGEAVTKFLGDFASLTAFERKFLGRGFMFYPFVRFSTRVALYTMPIEHPMVGGILAEIGNMEAEQREELFGEGSLRWTGGKIYLPGGKAVNFTKLNPVGNAALGALQEHRPAALLGVMPPFVGAMYNQLSDEDYFTGSRQLYEGDPSKAYAEGVGDLDLGDPTRLRIAASDFLGLSSAYRGLNRMGINPAQGFQHDPALEGYQGADSLAFSPRPVKFKGEGSKEQKLKSAAAKRNEAVRQSNDTWLQQFIPFLPENENDAERHRQQLLIDAEHNRPKTGNRKKSGGFGSGGGGGFGTGGF